ncbi:hypothetical protein LZK76_17415 [Rhizobium leguminosarum]|nr:hypothetical protein LZK76_17415 [Rhizobium leguminosarum]
MTRVYGDDFIPIKPHGNLGDGGMDGHFMMNGTVYQCYGAENGHVLRHDYVCKKMKDDFEHARSTTDYMKEWRFTHNLVDGLTREMNDALQKIMQEAEPLGIKVRHFGLAGFRELLSKMSEADRVAVLGVKAVNDLQLERLPEEISALVKALMEEVRPVRDTIKEDPAGRVPINKLQINDIPEHWTVQIKFFLRYSQISRAVVTRSGDRKTPIQLPAYFRLKYETLRNEGLNPTQIILNLKALVVGQVIDLVDDLRDFAAMTLLADLFESCVIFEEAKKEELREVENDLAD